MPDRAALLGDAADGQATLISEADDRQVERLAQVGQRVTARAPSTDIVAPRYGSVAMTPTGWPFRRASAVTVAPPYSA